LLEAAQEELAAFERREREFSKKEKQERAAELQIPAGKNELNVKAAARIKAVDNET
jgi:hypothetical protein